MHSLQSKVSLPSIIWRRRAGSGIGVIGQIVGYKGMILRQNASSQVCAFFFEFFLLFCEWSCPCWFPAVPPSVIPLTDGYVVLVLFLFCHGLLQNREAIVLIWLNEVTPNPNAS